MRAAWTGAVVTVMGLMLPSTPAGAEPPLSVIDWLDQEQQQTPVALPGRPAPFFIDEPPVTEDGTAPSVTVRSLDGAAPRDIGLVPQAVTGLPADIWERSKPDDILRLFEALPELRLPAANALLYTVLLAEAGAPQGGPEGLARLTLARVQKLMALGALDPALSLIEQAGNTASPAHFDLWMQISLLTGDEDIACGALSREPHLSADYANRIFCLARSGEWDTAAITFNSVSALGLVEQDKLRLLDRFLNPDLFEDEAPLPAPRQMDPLSFRLFETIGEPLPTGPLPRAYAVADLRDLAGWKSQLEAAERLTRAGAMPENRLLGLYTDRKPAASGGIWDRVSALQRFETALASGSADAVAKTLPPVWAAMKEAELETAFAGLFSERLQDVTLTDGAQKIKYEVGLLSPFFETVAGDPPPGAEPLLRAVARGEIPQGNPTGRMSEAVRDAFADAAPVATLIAQAQEKKLGEAILGTLDLLAEGSAGDPAALRDALATLRSLGLEDTARRAALQVLLLERAT